MISIRFKNIEYEIEYNDDTIELDFAIDNTFNRGYFETVPLSKSTGLDFSKRIPRDLLVTIEYQNKVFEMKTGETSIEQVGFGSQAKYIHTVNLISLEKDLTFKTLENITLQQPKGNLGQYNRSVNVGIDFTITPVNGQDWVLIGYANSINTNTSKINGMSIVTPDEYEVSHSFVINYKPPLVPFYYDIRFKFKGVVIKQEAIKLKSTTNIFAKNTNHRHDTTFKHRSLTTGNYTVEIKKRDEFVGGDNLISNITFALTGYEVIEKPERTYAHLVDKILRNTEYVLRADSRSRLNLVAPETKFEEHTLADALERIASELRALFRVGNLINARYWGSTITQAEDIIGFSLYDFNAYDYDVGTILKIGTSYYENKESDKLRRELYFNFYDDTRVIEIESPLNVSERAELDDYVSTLELNTKNVIKPLRYSPYRGGFKSLRSLDGTGKLTTDNIGFETEDVQERITKVIVKGYPCKSTSHTFGVDSEIDISGRVLEESHYNSLTSQVDHTLIGKQDLRKNNTLYFKQGDTKIYGMSYIGEDEKKLIGSPDVTRALYETILATLSNKYGELFTRTGGDDIGVADDLDIEMQVVYQNQTESRARVYKDDLSGFENERVKFINESSNVNESDSIGSYAQQLVNRLGGTKIFINGVADNIDDVPEVGDKDSKGRVYSFVKIKPRRVLEYDCMLVQDYNIISSYIGTKSRHRVEEISSDSNTLRTLRYQSRVIFVESPRTFQTRLVGHQKILETLLNQSSIGLTYGYLECNLSNGDKKKIHLSIDTDSKGKTIEIKWRMKNNYSAGQQREMIMIGSDEVWLTKDVPYVDYYGKVNDIIFYVYFDTAGNIDKDIYPQATTSDGDDLFVVINDTVDKDGGEILSGLVEIPIMSANEKVRVYEGFAKHNKIVEGTERIRTAVLHYIPPKNARKINLGLASDVSVVTTIDYDNVRSGFISAVDGVGIAYYNIDTLDFLLAYIDDVIVGVNQFNMPYIILDDLYGGGQNFTSNIRTGYKVKADYLDGTNKTVSINVPIIYNQVLELGDDYQLDSIDNTLTIKYDYLSGLNKTVANINVPIRYNTSILDNKGSQTGDIDYVTTIWALVSQGTNKTVTINVPIKYSTLLVEAQRENQKLDYLTTVKPSIIKGSNVTLVLNIPVKNVVDINTTGQPPAASFWLSITSTQYNALSSKGTYERNGNVMNVCPTISVSNLPPASNYSQNFGMKLIATKPTPFGDVECDVLYFKAL